MPVTRIRPNGTLAEFFAITGGSASVHAALSDQADSTYVRKDAAGTVHKFQMGTHSVPADELLVQVAPGLRLKKDGTADSVSLYGVLPISWGAGSVVATNALGIGWPLFASATSLVLKAAEAGAAGLTRAGGAWSEAQLDDLQLWLEDTSAAASSTRPYFYELFADVYTLKRATCAVTAPTGSTASALPAIAVTVSTVVESWQLDQPGLASYATAGLVELKVFTAAQVAAQGFDPTTSSPLWSDTVAYDNVAYTDGTTPTTVGVAGQIDVPIAGSNFRCYARASRAGVWGDWSYSTFSVTVDTPTAPTVTAACSSELQRASVSVTPVAKTNHASPVIDLERSSDGATWTAVRGSGVAGTFGAATTFYDYEATRGVALTYRARVRTSYLGAPAASAWTSAAASSEASIGIDPSPWNLKCPLDPSLNVLGVLVGGDPEERVVDESAVFRPKGRQYPIVVSGDLGGTDGTYQVLCNTEQQWAALKALLLYQGTIYVETAYGDARYIRVVGDRAWTRAGTRLAPRRPVAFSYVEVEAP